MQISWASNAGFRDLMVEIADRTREKTAHLPDDTLRTLQLYVLAQGGRQYIASERRSARAPTP